VGKQSKIRGTGGGKTKGSTGSLRKKVLWKTNQAWENKKHETSIRVRAAKITRKGGSKGQQVVNAGGYISKRKTGAA